MTVWTALVAAALICLACKLAGHLVPPRLFEPAPVARSAELVPVALLAALIVTQTLTGADGGLALDARVPALGVAAVLLLLRAPFLLVVLGAAATAALLRLL